MLWREKRIPAQVEFEFSGLCTSVFRRFYKVSSDKAERYFLPWLPALIFGATFSGKLQNVVEMHCASFRAACETRAAGK